MSWEDREFQQESGGIDRGDVRPPNAGDYDGPRGGDEELLYMLDVWDREDNAEVAQQFVDRGAQLIGSFLDRHQADVPEGNLRRLREKLRAAEQFAAFFEEEGDGLGVAAQLVKALNSIEPVIRTTALASVRRRQARGGRDHVPGPASDAQRTDAARARQIATERIDADIREMPAYRKFQEYQDAALRGLSVEDELNMYTAQKEVLLRQRFMWREANELSQGAYHSKLNAIERDLAKQEEVIDATMQSLSGVGYAAAQA